MWRCSLPNHSTNVWWWTKTSMIIIRLHLHSSSTLDKSITIVPAMFHFINRIAVFLLPPHALSLASFLLFFIPPGLNLSTRVCLYIPLACLRWSIEHYVEVDFMAMNLTTRTPFCDSLDLVNHHPAVISLRPDRRWSTLRFSCAQMSRKQRPTSSWYQTLSRTINHFYMQFLLLTTLYVMEPWERCLAMSIFFLLISLATYSALVYIPFHFQQILQATMPIMTDVLMR